MSIVEGVGAGAFGALVGYLAWHAVRLEPTKKLTLERLRALPGAIVGVAIMAVFPNRAGMVPTYLAALSVTFLLCEVGAFLAGKTPAARTQLGRERRRQEREEQEAWVDSNWDRVDRFIRARLAVYGELAASRCAELGVDHGTVEAALKRYALLHAVEGVIWHEFSGFERALPRLFGSLVVLASSPTSLFDTGKLIEPVRFMQINQGARGTHSEVTDGGDLSRRMECNDVTIAPV